MLHWCTLGTPFGDGLWWSKTQEDHNAEKKCCVKPSLFLLQTHCQFLSKERNSDNPTEDRTASRQMTTGWCLRRFQKTLTFVSNCATTQSSDCQHQLLLRSRLEHVLARALIQLPASFETGVSVSYNHNKSIPTATVRNPTASCRARWLRPIPKNEL